MSEIEVPLEKVNEDIHHAALHSGGYDQFINRGALLSAFLSVFAAIAALLAGHYSNEALIAHIQSSDKWAYYQAKGIKSEIVKLKDDLKPHEDNQERVLKYKEEQEEIKKQAEEKEIESEVFLKKHEHLAMAVTFFQIAVALTAISVLTKKRRYFHFSCGLGLIGLIVGLYSYFFIH